MVAVLESVPAPAELVPEAPISGVQLATHTYRQTRVSMKAGAYATASPPLPRR